MTYTTQGNEIEVDVVDGAGGIYGGEEKSMRSFGAETT
jgi:hypothetical protein